MIFEWLLGLLDGLADFGLGLTDGLEVPDWLDGFAGLFADVAAACYGLGAWVPWWLVIGAVTATFSIWSVGLLVKAVRWLVGWIPTMGGG